MPSSLPRLPRSRLPQGARGHQVEPRQSNRTTHTHTSSEERACARPAGGAGLRCAARRAPRNRSVLINTRCTNLVDKRGHNRRRDWSLGVSLSSARTHTHSRDRSQRLDRTRSIALPRSLTHSAIHRHASRLTTSQTLAQQSIPSTRIHTHRQTDTRKNCSLAR